MITLTMSVTMQWRDSTELNQFYFNFLNATMSGDPDGNSIYITAQHHQIMAQEHYQHDVGATNSYL